MKNGYPVEQVNTIWHLYTYPLTVTNIPNIPNINMKTSTCGNPYWRVLSQARNKTKRDGS